MLSASPGGEKRERNGRGVMGGKKKRKNLNKTGLEAVVVVQQWSNECKRV